MRAQLLRAQGGGEPGNEARLVHNSLCNLAIINIETTCTCIINIQMYTCMYMYMYMIYVHVYQYSVQMHVINPRRACAARVTVVVLCVSVCLSVCQSVCLRLFSDYRLRGGI